MRLPPCGGVCELALLRALDALGVEDAATAGSGELVELEVEDAAVVASVELVSVAFLLFRCDDLVEVLLVD
jgi:hypothetical protein